MVETMRRWYFVVAAFLLLALTVTGFWDNLVSDIGQKSNSDPKFIMHGLLCGAWMILLFIQTSLVGSGNLTAHRKLGIAGMAIAIGVTESGGKGQPVAVAELFDLCRARLFQPLSARMA
jgi:hypothetical protein